MIIGRIQFWHRPSSADLPWNVTLVAIFKITEKPTDPEWDQSPGNPLRTILAPQPALRRRGPTSPAVEPVPGPWSGPRRTPDI